MTGRLKELLITAGGENVAPKPIEDAVLSALNGAASHAILVGDRRKFLACLIALKSEVDPETLAPKEQLASGAMDFVRAVGSKAETLADVAKDELVAKAVQVCGPIRNIQLPTIPLKSFSVRKDFLELVECYTHNFAGSH